MFVFSSVEIALITPVSVIRHCSSDKIQHLKTPHNPPQKKYKKIQNKTSALSESDFAQ